MILMLKKFIKVGFVFEPLKQRKILRSNDFHTFFADSFSTFLNQIFEGNYKGRIA
jgi:hypothetical protein